MTTANTTINEVSRIGSTLVTHYVISETIDIVEDNGHYFVWHNGKSVACFGSDTEAIEYGDKLFQAKSIAIAVTRLATTH